jgi:poly(3-hydroxybutyrate) depolymerase
VGIGSELDWKDHDWFDNGKVYIPKSCYEKTCKVHVAFHGCWGNADDFDGYSMYRDLASTNDVILVYPNSYCWGNDVMMSKAYKTRDGLHAKAIMAMICRLTSDAETNNCPTK